MLRMNDLVEQENGAGAAQAGPKSYPCGSAPVWKRLAEVSGFARDGRSQRGAAMSRDEGASQLDSGGWRFSLTVARASSSRAKRGSRVFSALPASPMRLLWRATRVLRVVTWRKRLLLRTIELPRRSHPACQAGITASYKARPKGRRHASVRRTNFLRPALQGTQQDQSSGEAFPKRVLPFWHRLNAIKGPSSSNSLRPVRTVGAVSQTLQAAIGPGRASSRLNRSSAKKHSRPLPSRAGGCGQHPDRLNKR